MFRTGFGITAIENEPHHPSTLIEIFPDESGLLLSEKLKTIRFSHWYLSGHEPSEQAERENLLFDAYASKKAAASILSAPPRLQIDDELKARIQNLSLRATQQGVDLYFDFGQSHPPSWAELTRCVSDPLWFRGETWSDYWRIHGWHTERWVRRYSLDDLKLLVQWARERNPKFVVLGHSQRGPQWLEVQALLS